MARWLHMLGFRGHVATKSRRYSVTLGHLRGARRRHTLAKLRETARARRHGHELDAGKPAPDVVDAGKDEDPDGEDSTLVIGS